MSNKATQDTVMNLRAQLAKAKSGMGAMQRTAELHRIRAEDLSRQVSLSCEQTARAAMEIKSLRNELANADNSAARVTTRLWEQRSLLDKEVSRGLALKEEAGKYCRRAREYKLMFWALVVMSVVRLGVDYVS